MRHFFQVMRLKEANVDTMRDCGFKQLYRILSHDSMLNTVFFVIVLFFLILGVLRIIF